MSRRASKRAGTRRNKKVQSEPPAPLEERDQLSEPVEMMDSSAAVEEEVETLRASAVELLPSKPPPPPPPPIPSGIAPRPGRAREQEPDELAEFLVGLRPYYRETERRSERAPALEVEDLSLRYDNPYVHSSLVPPSTPPRWKSKSVLLGLIGGAGALVVIGGALLLFWSRDRPRADAEPRTVQAPAVAVTPLAVAAVSVPTTPAQPPGAATQLTAGSAREPEAVAPPQPAEAELPAPASEPVVEQPPPAPAPVRAPQHLVSSRPPVVRAPAVEPPQSAPHVAALTTTSATAKPASTAPAVAAPPPAGAAWPAAPAPAVASAPAPAAEVPSEVPSGPLPRLPPARSVKMSFEKIHSPLSACAAGKHGLVTIHATVNNEGRIVSAFVDGVFKSQEEQSCMARVILTLRLPPFTQSIFKVSYPLAL